MALVQTQNLSLPKLRTSTKIPIVRHLIKDDEIEPTQEEQLVPLELDRIIKLFVDPHSVNY